VDLGYNIPFPSEQILTPFLLSNILDMWNTDDSYDEDSEGSYGSEQETEEQDYDAYDPNHMTGACQYRCCWDDEAWCTFPVTRPQLNWSTTAQSSAASPPGVTYQAKTRSN